MSKEDNSRPLKATLKAGGGYEAPWLTIEAKDAEDLDGHLDALTEGVLGKVADVADLFRAAHAAVAPSSSSGGGATVTPINGGGADTKTCEHGVREFKSGNKNGKSWAAWFCPEKDKSAQCKPVWKD